MHTLTFKSKRAVGIHGDFEYTYECFCSPKPVKQIVVTAGNDNEARVLAEAECREYCGEPEE